MNITAPSWYQKTRSERFFFCQAGGTGRLRIRLTSSARMPDNAPHQIICVNTYPLHLKTWHPGTMRGPAALPLNWDSCTSAMIEHLNSPCCWNFMNVLDGYGGSVAQLNVTGPMPADLVNEVLSFAYALYYPWDFASVPVDIEIVE